jgi:recombination protein RecA
MSKDGKSVSKNSMVDNSIDQNAKGDPKGDSKIVKFDSIDRNKITAVEQAIKQIKSTHGEGSIMFFGERGTVEKVKTIQTGSLLLDYALGIGGIPLGRITEIYGNEGSGKTTLALHIVANAQKNGGICAFIDAEHALDISYAKKIGISIQDLIIAQPNSGEEAIEIAEHLIRSGGIDVIILDSVAALVPKTELEGDMEDSLMGGQARLMSKALRKIVPSLSKTDTAMVFINQIRSKIGVMFGNPETTTGGYALRFYSSIRLEVKKKALLKKAEIVIGQEMEVKICKNKFAPPYRKVDFELIYGQGINNIGELIDLAVAQGILQKNGTWFSLGDRKLGQGKDYLTKVINEDSALHKQLLGMINAGDIAALGD